MRLDDLYHMTAYIYTDQNADRSRIGTFAHFVEVCGLLVKIEGNGYQPVHLRSADDTEGQLTMPIVLCKALGWFFPLAARLRVASLERIVFRKFPTVCPYCREAPHRTDCDSTSWPDHEELERLYEVKAQAMPETLTDWQRMFNTIYPRGHGTRTSASKLFEEVGELAEALRFFDRRPQYALGEMADVFSYLMGIANEYTANIDAAREFDYGASFLLEYPGVCRICVKERCACKPRTEARAAKEAPVEIQHDLVTHPQWFVMAGAELAKGARARHGGPPTQAIDRPPE